MKISIVTPVYNDWESLNYLIKDLELSFQKSDFILDKIIAVNDGSNQKVPSELDNNILLKVLNLATNMGHQRAICLGLCYCQDNINDSNLIVVMDSDGEDNACDVIRLINKSIKDNSKIVFAKRSKRSEGLIFRISYFIYKIIFKLLTGDRISFGNFSCISKLAINQIISNPDSWNHYSGSVLKSKLKFSEQPTQRGKRYFGSSKMNFTNLILHGLSSIALYIDIIVIRLLMLNIFFVVSSFITLISLFFIKFFSSFKIPGWTPIYTLGIFNILLLTSIFTLVLVLIQLANRSNVRLSPKNFYKSFISD